MASHPVLNDIITNLYGVAYGVLQSGIGVLGGYTVCATVCYMTQYMGDLVISEMTSSGL